MKKNLIFHLFVMFFWVSPTYAVVDEKVATTTADHKKFEVLKQDFKSGPEVTKACLSCHTEAAKEVHKSIHWRWEWDKGLQPGLGKKNAVNNF